MSASELYSVSQKPASSRISRFARLIEFIRKNDGRIRPREVVRHGFGCRSTHDANQLLTALVGDGLGKWYRGRSTPRGGRRGMVFILNPDAKEPPCYSHIPSTLEAAVQVTVMGADELRTLAWELGRLLVEHQRLQPTISAKSMAKLLREFSKNLK